jgi:poly(ADP-ribose) glycohydrolase ARH3
VTSELRLLERVHGVMLGAACGDALGAPFEGSPTVRDAELTEWMSSPRVLRYTDDTAMMIALAEYLLALPPAAHISEQHLAEAFADHWRREPWRGYGAGPPHVFRLVLAGWAWVDAAVALYPPHGSFGNGGAMRVAPVACLEPDLDRVVAEARASARPTHLHPLGQDGAALQAAAVWSALHSPPDEPIDTDGFVHRLDGFIETAEFRKRLDSVPELARSATAEQAAGALGHGIAAEESVPTALLAFLRHPDSFVEALRFAIRIGGDTDTIAAMTGAIAGARHGVDAIPVSWLARLENEPRIRAQATRLGLRLRWFGD